MPIADERELNRYSISLHDFEKASACVEAAQKRCPNDLVYEALLFMAIVSYYRPFSSNQKNANDVDATSRLRLEDLVDVSPRERELHEECERLRNKALAHSEFSHNPTHLNASTGVISSRPFSLFAQPLDLDCLAKLLKKLQDVCHSKRAQFSIKGLASIRGAKRQENQST